ncbi:hypothetical protein AS156_36980 [Bradyrhizobium macuxiense]|uniref:Uncharacterized protein n=1 Tax=Bradyrhizobium macuxiense TaxID=1755647 RepID=A0A109JZ56_9BRAD|nr:hypothetical protein [Bradyrhizobium macuxiense]KWV57807.1 hypothetical protein AS156_36980 [Bradyrhizobium macuxiense]
MRSRCFIVGVVPPLLGVVFLALGSTRAAATACALRSRDGATKHVVQIQLGYAHLRRENPNVPSDLEQMPHLLDFFARDGTVGGNHRVPLVQKAAAALTILTGLYGDRTGVPVADSYGYFRGDGSIGFANSRAYWTTTGGDGKPLMLADTGKTVSAPWVPFTRAGCDVGALATANLELQNLAPDVVNVFGPSSPEASEAASDPARAKADLLGIAIHCARASSLCANAETRPDILPDEPGGYSGFSALFGNRHVQPVISPGGPIKDLGGNVLNTADNAGSQNVFELGAAQSLSYAATMLEAGVPVVYVSIGDISDPRSERASGPGEPASQAGLSAFDTAFKLFIDRLAADGINKANTLFIIVAAENDHFASGPPTPPDCDGVALPCAYPQIGEIDTAINRLLVTQRRNVTAFDIHFGSAPSFYIRDNPLATDPLTRTLEQDVSKLIVLNPITNKNDNLAAFFADRAEMQLLHMITGSSARSANFIMFGDPNYFNETVTSQADCSASAPCVEQNPKYARTDGNVPQISDNAWFGMAGPGVAHLGLNMEIVSGHTDLRPTMLALVGLTDSYVHDGVVLAEAVEPGALAPELQRGRDAFIALAYAYRELNDPLGQLGRNSLAFSTQAIKSTDTDYARYLDAIGAVIAARAPLVRETKALLDGAAFAHRPIDPAYARVLIDRADALVRQVEDLAGSSIGRTGRPWKAANDQH